MRDGSLVNLTMNQETGVSVETIRGYGDIRPTDVNSDTILEMPRPHLLPTYGENLSSDFWLIDWSQYDVEGGRPLSLPPITTCLTSGI